MNGLRVYTHASAVSIEADASIFYSRRGDGPFYRWLYEGEHEGWRCSRVRLTKSSVTLLRGAKLSAVPAALQVRLGEHYLE
jgi:hypothetical protein